MSPLPGRPLGRSLAVLSATLVMLTVLMSSASANVAPRLQLGIYPWGAAGATTAIAPSVPENADRSMAAVRSLKGDRPFVVHVYGDYTGVSNASADGLLSEAAWWSANGMKVSAVLRYRPADTTRAAGYPAWVRTQTRRLAALTGLSSIHVGNEPNNLSPGAGDGSYPGVIPAIAAGVPAARAELDALGRSGVRVGFNWAAGSFPTTTEPMWAALRQAGGPAFTSAVGFVAVNVYPGTWSPPSVLVPPTATQVASTVRTTLDALRTRHMPTAGVGGADIIVGETGYPTSSTRTEAAQELVLRTVVDEVETVRGLYGVTDLYAFALRDGNTASGQLENGYGLLRDDYSAKPAFAVLKHAVARPESEVPVPTQPVTAPPEPAPAPTESAPAPTEPAPAPAPTEPTPISPTPTPTPIPTAPAPAPAPGKVKGSPKLRVSRAALVGTRTLELVAPISRAAKGRVRITVRAAGRTTRFTAKVSRGRILVRRALPRTRSRVRRAVLTVRYDGDSRMRAQTVRRVATR